MKRKGFTLVELLAVILVLGIIALISVPIVTNIIKESKIKAAQATTYNYVKAIEDEMALKMLDRTNPAVNSFNNNTSTKKLFIGKDSILDNLKVQGQKPTSGIITLDEDNSIKQADLCVNNYYVMYKSGKAKVVGNECDFRIESSLTYKIADDINDKIGNNECANNNGTYSDKCYFTGDRNKITTNKILYTGLIWDIIGIEPNGDLKLISEQPLTSLSWGDYSSLKSS
ncbi:MAG TPA: prepilin-type N-terminal cleavage/methylation domain-containing protein, partial [Bacilli bacterium]|nr:prepilin-type N-terminal cleavage/methylation domain-containing protein [Bacilli bacterium]